MEHLENLFAKCKIGFFEAKYSHFEKETETVQMGLKFQHVVLVQEQEKRVPRQYTSTI